jgi:hypothetical protein
MTGAHSLHALLQLPSDCGAEMLQEAYEQKLFEARQDLLQKFAVPSLIRKKIKSLEAFAQLEQHAGPVQPEAPFGAAAMANRIEFLEMYEKKMSELRLALTNAPSFAELSHIATSLALQQDYYMIIFAMHFSEHYKALPEEVNTRDMIDTGKLILQLKAGNPDDKMSWEIEKELARIHKIHQLL